MQTWAGSSTPVFHYFLSGTHDPTFICYTHLHHPVSRSNFSFFSHSRYTLSWNAARHGDDFQSSARWPCIRHFYLYTSTDVTCQSRHRFYFQSKHFAFFTCRTFCENSSLTDLKCNEQKNYESLVFYRFKKIRRLILYLIRWPLYENAGFIFEYHNWIATVFLCSFFV